MGFDLLTVNHSVGMGDGEKLLYSKRAETRTDRKAEKKPEVQRALCV